MKTIRVVIDAQEREVAETRRQGVITVVVGDPEGTLEAHPADSLRMNLRKPEDESIGLNLNHGSSVEHRADRPSRRPTLPDGAAGLGRTRKWPDAAALVGQVCNRAKGTGVPGGLACVHRACRSCQQHLDHLPVRPIHRRLQWRSSGSPCAPRRSASRPALSAALVVCGGVSITLRSAPGLRAASSTFSSRFACVAVATGLSLSRRSAQVAADPCVSRSTSTAGYSARSASTPNPAGHRDLSGSAYCRHLLIHRDARENVGMMMGELYAVGWRAPDQARQWVWAVFPSLDGAVRVARGYAKLDGGGRWRVYSTRVVAASGSVREVRDRVLAEGVERTARHGRRPDG